MSITILEFVRAFVNDRLSADIFANAYMELWKIERDGGTLKNYESNVDECLSSIFCVADLYNPEIDREEYELDSIGLKNEIKNIMKKNKLNLAALQQAAK